MHGSHCTKQRLHSFSSFNIARLDLKGVAKSGRQMLVEAVERAD